MTRRPQRPSRRLIPSLALSTLVIACAPLAQGDEPMADGNGQEIRRTGQIAVVGSIPTESLVLRTDRGPIALEGERTEELRQLTGAQVTVVGSGNSERIQVHNYDVLAIGGRPVISGDVEEARDGSLVVRTPAGQLYQLHDAPSAVRPGQTVWLQGPASIRVQRYGIIRER